MSDDLVMWALNWGVNPSHVHNAKTFYKLDNLLKFKEENVEAHHCWRIVKLDFLDSQRQFPIPYLYDANYPNADEDLK